MDHKAPVEYRSYVFLLESEGVHGLEHEVYVTLARGEARMPERAGRAMRLADWYVRLEGGRPVSLASEWYGWVRFDALGRLLTHDGVPPLSNNHTEVAERYNVDTAALPGAVELEVMRTLVFGDITTLPRNIASPV